ncbi:MAG: NADH dehydrogenase (quinone) subunit D [Sphaerobacter thermophilus]|jgi:NADH dehydrogenase I D subunit|uniref:NADH-quinone oxidoreductase subunit D n=2 Tax=Sphaerobacter TaxID=2056 RepID=D1C6X3_SPHTD|nr:NADH dehydrogenase (quinone) subunit D [Sphaerobacter thermophilus]ACZ37734.1 NADH dehydrogenase I, D subunit [Sphaerobacter thermophilus DSM 20745]PZN66094.1 MAG: NADH dehydrogenase (quinone) subunit D [Sphaerobacter thermophilus]
MSLEITEPTPVIISEERQISDTRREMVLNMGPQHPSTHGVLRVRLTLEGETITACDPVIGYLHRGVEKIGESKRYAQFTPWTDRTDYVAAPSNNLGYVLAVEKLLGIEAPERAQYWRMIMGELARIASHLVWLGTHALDIGALSMSLYCFRERELILDIFEKFCGARLTTNMMEIGGFSRPIPAGLPEMIRDFLKVFPQRQREYEDLLSANPIWLARTRGVGVIEPDVAINYGLTGACLRGSGVNYDVRKAQPYLLYDRIDFEVPLGTQGDVYDRYLVRMEEMRQSLKIIEQCLDQVPTDGPLKLAESNYVIPPHETVLTTAEDMQRHFIWVIKGFSPPKGEVYMSIEHSKGELGYYIVSDGSPVPYRLRIRTPDFVNLQSLPYLAEGAMLADVVALIGTIDIVLGSVDR